MNGERFNNSVHEFSEELGQVLSLPHSNPDVVDSLYDVEEHLQTMGGIATLASSGLPTEIYNPILHVELLEIQYELNYVIKYANEHAYQEQTLLERLARLRSLFIEIVKSIFPNGI